MEQNTDEAKEAIFNAVQILAQAQFEDRLDPISLSASVLSSMAYTTVENSNLSEGKDKKMRDHLVQSFMAEVFAAAIGDIDKAEKTDIPMTIGRRNER